MARMDLWRLKMGILILFIPAWGCVEDDAGELADSGIGLADSGIGLADSGIGLADSGIGLADAAPDAAPPPPPPEPEPSLVDQLMDCRAQMACRWTESQAAEGGPLYDVTAGEAICLLESVRDRRPGRYVHRLVHGHSQGNDTFFDVAVIRADGSISFAWGMGRAHADGGDEHPEPLPGDEGSAECETPPAAWFDACIDLLRPLVGRAPDGNLLPAEVAACLRIDGRAHRRSALDPPWLSDCVPAAPRCEAD